MSLYHVINKATGAKVYEYAADAPIEWAGFEFETHDHVAQPVAGAPADTTRAEDWFINVGPFYDRFGAYKLPILASADPLVQAVIKDTTVRKYIDLRGRRPELAQALALLRSKGFAVTDAAVLDVQPTAAEVYRG
jgi:hypothetical protein